ncbi:MAG: tetratricopeptide repeat protein [Alphaproteobacteria bacterium]|nr:tetratricopeptide repeat protein [Alphaproteobacteria bacterium]
MSDPSGHLESLRKAATAHYRRGEFAAAQSALAAALKLDPGSAEMWSNFGTVQAALSRHDEAVDSFTRALRLKPGLANAHLNRAQTLLVLRRYEEAIPDYEFTLRAAPDHPYSLGDLIFCKLQCCDWNELDALRTRAAADLRAGKRAVTPLLAAALLEAPEDQLRALQIIARDRLAPKPPLWRGERYRHDRIRVAYVSADFHAHPTAVLMAGVFEHHDTTRFETIAVSFGPDDESPMRARLTRSFERFIDARGENDAAIAARMREEEIDIAVDLKGFTSDARPDIFAFRPAPVQVNYLGFPASMGADFMDYLIADSVLVPETDEIYYSENIVRLPHSYQPNDRSRGIAATPSRAEAGLPQHAFVFCCFNNSYKIQPTIFDLWMRLLAKFEGSVLWLLEDNSAAARNLSAKAEARGIAPHRLVFAPRIAQEQHLARQRLADVFLDTLPYNAHTTASDALFAGLPVLTCLGTTFAGRVAASLNYAMGVPELVTQSLEDYEALALALARDAARLAKIRGKLAANRDTGPLFDAALFTKHLETAYTAMWERNERGEKPESFSVAPV